MRLDLALSALAKIEYQLSELYGIYIEIFSEDKTAATLFNKLRKEELAHKNLIDLQIRLLSKTAKGSTEIALNADDIQKTSKRIEQHIQDGIFSVEEAVAFAIDIESSFMERHSNRVFKDAIPELAALMGSLAQGDEAHLRAIREFADQLRARG